MTVPEYVECIRAESAGFRDVITADTLDLDVESCPGWTVRDLAHHLGRVQRWARIAAQTAASPAPGSVDDPPTGSEDEVAALTAWLAAGSDALCDALASLDPDAPTWHPFPAPKVAAVWPRRQAHEVAIHRWDAQHAAGIVPTAFDPVLAADFVREYFDVIVPRVIDRDGRAAPIGRLAIHLTDVRVDALVVSTGDVLTIADFDGDETDGSLSGAVDGVLLALWQRRSQVEASGPLAAEWLAFGGN